jgi:hypothetical protein
MPSKPKVFPNLKGRISFEMSQVQKLTGMSSYTVVKVKVKVKVKVTLLLAVYHQSVHLGIKPLEIQDQRLFSTEHLQS